MRRQLAAWLPVALWAALIFVLSSIPGTRLPKIDLPQSDKMVHALVYGMLGALLQRAQDMTVSRGRQRANLIATILLVSAYGVSDEIHQLWTPNRSADWRDVIADACGGTAGALAIVAMQWMKIHGCLMMGRSKNPKCSPTREPR
jgi:VanZ family protein